MNQHVRPHPDALPRITPHLVVKGASAALELYEKALGAKEPYRTVGHDGRIAPPGSPDAFKAYNRATAHRR